MTEEDDNMMLELTKKKKKKKIANIDDLISSSASTKPSTQETEPTDNVANELEELGLGKKKSKKKMKARFADELEQLESNKGKDGEGDIDSGEELMSMDKTDDDDELNFGEKKKKKTKVAISLDDDEEDIEVASTKSWLDSDRDYTYDELLTRVFDIMRKKNPEMIAGEKKRFVMKPPQCGRVGTRKTSFINFSEICQVLRRQPKHVLAFILAELGTSGSVDGNNQLIIKGRFQQKQLESVLRRYIKEYVTCHTCRSPDTALERKDRLYFLRCNVCQSRCSVASIKSGFQAVTGKRARMRAKAT